MNHYPKRPVEHQLEEASIRYFRQCLPLSWTSDRPGSDYGVDLRVDIFENDHATGLEILVQIKASARASEGEEESIVLKTSTYNMLREKLQMVLLVKYSHAENEAYWSWLRNVSEPQEGRDSVTATISKANRLSIMDWDRVREHVRYYSDAKLALARKLEIEHRG